MPKKQFRVFYSWQSDLDNATNRGLIEAALKSAAKEVRNDDSIEIEPVIVRDTQGLTGAPDIGKAILDKIDNSAVFVGDVSIINAPVPDGVRATPNPNVLVELGYAVKHLGWSRVLMVFNTAYGKPEDLPFDLRLKRAVQYCSKKDDADRSTPRKALV